MLQVVDIGPFALRTAQLLIIVGLAFSLEVITRYANHRNANSQSLQNSLWIGFIVFLLGSRASYIALNWSVYQNDPQAWISLTPQAMFPLGGVALVAVALIVYTIPRSIPLRPLLDLFAPGIAVLIIFVNLAFLAEGDYFGRETDLPWAIDLWSADRHPTQVYAVIGGILTLIIWMRWQMRLTFSGQGFLLIVTGNAVTWLLVSMLLASPAIVFNQYRREQVMMWVVLVVVAFLWNLWQNDDIQAAVDQPS
ncbi:MAG: prolipoprotein diacylglyceryl transferase [Chloroflexi bacterium]|nr:prolipoprotein diacylglyceryl transferase [Chloroflexota bacterium]